MIRVWPGVAPGSEDWTHEEVEATTPTGGIHIRNVVVPTLTPYLPDPSIASGTAMIVAPGGAFQVLCWDYEGTEVAEWFQQRGVTAFLLKYRLTYTGASEEEMRERAEAAVARMREGEQKLDLSEMLGKLVGEYAHLAAADGEQAVRVVRERASEWSVDPDKIGFMGFSAGAFVTTGVAVTDDPAARPNFVAPIYGGVPHKPVTSEAPPLFCAVAADDPFVDACLATFQSWRAAGRPAELHVYAQGGHGFGMNKLGLPSDTWIERLADWMVSLGYLSP